MITKRKKKISLSRLQGLEGSEHQPQKNEKAVISVNALKRNVGQESKAPAKVH